MSIKNSSTFTESFTFTAEHVDIASKEFDGLFHDVVGEENLSFLEQDGHGSHDFSQYCRRDTYMPVKCVERWTCDVCKSRSFETFAEADAH